MKPVIRSIPFSCLFILVFGLSSVHARGPGSPPSLMDMIPYESIAYASISDLDVVFNSVKQSPEWQELLSIEQIKDDLDNARQAISFGPMLFGISVDEFLGSFGHSMAVCLMGMNEQIPIAGLIVDAGDYGEQVEYAIEQAATLPAVAGGAMVEDDEYRDTPFTVVGNETLKVKYSFLDNFLIAGIGGGFEKLIDHYKDGGRSIKDSPNLQFMERKVSLSSEICVYADLERAAPILKHIMGTNPGEAGEGDQFNAMMANLAFESMRAFALSLSLSGQTHEVYLHLKPAEPNPITHLILAPHSPMSALDLVPLAGGVIIGVHIGDPAEILDRGLDVAEFLGAKEEIENQIQQLEKGLGLKMRDDLLSALTGEIALIAMLPREQMELNKDDKLQMAMQIARIRPVMLLGVKDRDRLEKTAGKLTKLAKLETLSQDDQSYKGENIHTKVVPLHMVIPGVAFMPSYSFRDDLLIMSNSTEWVQDTIDLLESVGARPPLTPESAAASATVAGDSEFREELAASRLLIYLDAGGIAGSVVEQEIIQDSRFPEAAQDKLSSLGSVAAGLLLEPDGVGIRLISTSGDDWATKIFRGVLVAIYANIGSEQEKQEEPAGEPPEEPEEPTGEGPDDQTH